MLTDLQATSCDVNNVKEIFETAYKTLNELQECGDVAALPRLEAFEAYCFGTNPIHFGSLPYTPIRVRSNCCKLTFYMI